LRLAQALIWLAAFSSPLEAGPAAVGKWTPLESLKYRLVTDVQVSPDGKTVAYVVRDSILEPDKSEYRTQIWLSTTQAGGKRSWQATSGPSSALRPRWSPDGEWLAFIGKRGQKTANVWRLPVRGGEAERLTDAPADVSEAAWSPDGRWIAYIAPDGPPADLERREKERDDARVVDEDDRPGRLWLVSVEPDAEGRFEGRKLLATGFSVGGSPDPAAAPDSLAFSPDGRTIAFSHTVRPVINEWPSSDISLVDVATGSVRPFAATGAAETSPRFTPDGRFLAYVVTDEPPRWAHRENIRLAPLDSSAGPARTLPPSFDESPRLAGFSADGTTLYFTEAKGVSDLLYAQNLATGAIRALTDEGRVVSGANVNTRGTWIGFVRQTATDPSEAWASALSPFTPLRVSDVNASLPKHALPETRVLSWKGDRGERIEGLLTLPVGYVSGTRYPLLLVIHGGPAGVFKLTHVVMPGAYTTAVFASAGYAVLRPNPRGSSGYGTAFRRANEKDWGGGDYRDLMAGVDAVIAMGIADPDRLGVAGWSYGGFMTAWIITQTDRFKAASIGAPVTDLVSFTGTADIPGFLPSYFGGEFWETDLSDTYRRHSPMNHVGRARTPALIQHGEDDRRVPISQGYELYNALKRQGVPTKMVTYPRQPHAIREPRLVRDVAERTLAWMEQWIPTP
jgi:dipeptidyl aminopeptidase/acylaminoacyl peptidase